MHTTINRARRLFLRSSLSGSGAPTQASLIILLVTAAALWLALAQVCGAPAVVPASAPAADFSGERAMSHLRVIAGVPHPVGAPAQAAVRQYILQQVRDMGLQPVVQDATGALAVETGVFASSLENILVRLPGSQSTGVVAIMAHYDSQPNTPGASDNGAAVAGILEAIRAAQAGKPLRNDLLFVLTDAEEVDAQGADAFYRQHPWAQEIRLLVNFEAAGNSGPSFLLETSAGNRGLAEGFMRAVPHPIAYSFMTQLLAFIPLGTDMTVFAENGVPTLGPVFGRHYRVMYHSMLDSVERVSPASVQHQGENALGLARYFGAIDLATLDTSTDAVYFSLVPGIVIHYPSRLAAPLAIGAAILLAVVVAAGLLRRRLSLGGIAAGLVVACSMVIVPVVLTALVWLAISSMHAEYWRNLMGSPYNGELYLLGFAALAAATCLAIFLIARRRLSAAHLTAGALLIWLALAVLTSVAAPGMSYVFTWPLVATTLVLAGLAFKPDRMRRSSAAGWRWPAALGGVLALIILIVAPVIFLVHLLIGLWMVTMTPAAPFIAVTVLLVALTLSLVAPQMDLLPTRRQWPLPAATALLALACLVAASLSSGFSAGQPMPNGVWYTLDADSGQATWSSYGARAVDAWTRQFFPSATEPVDLAALYESLGDAPKPPQAFKGPAEAAPLPAPVLTVLSDQTEGGVRNLRLHLASSRQARGLRVKVSGAAVLAATVNGNRQESAAWRQNEAWFLRYYGLPAQGIDLALQMEPSQALQIIVTDQSDGLPSLSGSVFSERPAGTMPFAMAQEYMPFPETTSVSKTFSIR